jgi:hypothetical protein
MQVYQERQPQPLQQGNLLTPVKDIKGLHFLGISVAFQNHHRNLFCPFFFYSAILTMLVQFLLMSQSNLCNFDIILNA